MIEVIGLGAGGHARVVIEILRSMKNYEIVGLLDPKSELWQTSVLEVPVLGDDDLLSDLHNQGVCHAFIGVGMLGNAQLRRRLYNKARRQGFNIVSAIHPRAIVSPSTEIGQGITIMPGAIINADVKIGENVIINTGAIIEHDCEIASHVHVATGARLAGTVRVDDGAFIGAGAVIKQSVSIGKHAVVGAGAVVIEDVPDNVVVVGVPAKARRILEV